MGGGLAHFSQGADPRVAMFGVVEVGNVGKCQPPIVIHYIVYGGKAGVRFRFSGLVFCVFCVFCVYW